MVEVHLVQVWLNEDDGYPMNYMFASVDAAVNFVLKAKQEHVGKFAHVEYAGQYVNHNLSDKGLEELRADMRSIEDAT